MHVSLLLQIYKQSLFQQASSKGQPEEQLSLHYTIIKALSDEPAFCPYTQ